MEDGVQEEFQSRVIRMRRAAVLGSPIKHSLSPVIHNAAYEMLGIEARYSAEEVGSDELDVFLTAQLIDPSWIGFSLTMPLKEVICSLVQKFNIEIDPVAARIQSVNTLYKSKNSWSAFSTDVTGFSYLLGNRELPTISILGSGGTARAAVESLPNSSLITIYRRSADRDALFHSAFPTRRIVFKDWSYVDESWSSDLVINAVPIAAINELVPKFKAPRLLLDALYSPWMPPLTALQMSAGSEVISGLDLLCAQALEQIVLMTGEDFDKDEMFSFIRKRVEVSI